MQPSAKSNSRAPTVAMLTHTVASLRSVLNATLHSNSQRVRLRHENIAELISLGDGSYMTEGKNNIDAKLLPTVFHRPGTGWKSPSST